MSARAARFGLLVAGVLAALLLASGIASAHSHNHASHSAHMSQASSDHASAGSVSELSGLHSPSHSAPHDHSGHERHRHGQDCPAHENCTCVDFGFCSYPDGKAHAKVNLPKQRFFSVRASLNLDLDENIAGLARSPDPLDVRSAPDQAALQDSLGWRNILHIESRRLRL